MTEIGAPMAELPSHMIPSNNSEHEEAWRKLMITNNVPDILELQVGNASLRAMAQAATVPQDVKRDMNTHVYRFAEVLSGPNPECAFVRFFAGGDYGRRVSVGSYNRLRLIAYAADNEGDDVYSPEFKKNVVSILRQHLQRKRRVSNCSQTSWQDHDEREEHYEVNLLDGPHILIRTSNGTEIQICIVSERSNPARLDKGGPHDTESCFQEIMRVMRFEISDPTWRASHGPEDADQITIGLVDEIASRSLAALPDSCQMFMRLCVYITVVHQLGLPSGMASALALKVVIDVTPDWTVWLHGSSRRSYGGQEHVLDFVDGLRRFLTALSDPIELKRLDSLEFPSDMLSKRNFTEKILLDTKQLAQISEAMNSAHRIYGDMFSNESLVVREFMRPSVNHAKGIEGDSIDWVRGEARRLSSMIEPRQSGVAPVSINELLSLNVNSPILRSRESKKEFNMGRERPSIAKLTRLAIWFLVTTAIAFSVMTIISLVLLSQILGPDAKVNEQLFRYRLEAAHFGLWKVLAKISEACPYVVPLLDTSVYGFFEDGIDAAMLRANDLPSWVNETVPERWRAELVIARIETLPAALGHILRARGSITFAARGVYRAITNKIWGSWL